ncbi:hypothetical protein BN1708_001067 [Verticillium longisporum]|uniref:Uncharacterized protein n=1 Tax=Verticillium longisporum TaxID=100787 RepID=A0A0G4MGS8_VERLO|nr:hypothetical protein BN1708_001067 [Verticillium longisporum]
MASANRHNGQAAAVQDPSWNNQTAPAAQAWNAQALLAPRSKQAVPSPAHGYPQRSYPMANQFAGAQHNGGMVFEFTGPSDMSNDSLPSSVPSTSSTPATDGRSTPNGQMQGLGGMIERMNGVQDRAYAPAIKRRKVDTPEADAEVTGKKGMTSGGSGVLGAYVKEKREEAQQNGTARPTHTVDLTLVDDDDVKVIDHPDNEETVRYIMRNSFEEKMIELQDKKKKLASLSMDGKGKALDRGDAARQKLMDLRSLFK